MQSCSDFSQDAVASTAWVLNGCVFTDVLGRRASWPPCLSCSTQGPSDKVLLNWGGGNGHTTLQNLKPEGMLERNWSIKQGPALPSSPPVIPHTSWLEMQSAFHKIICTSAGFEVQAASISLCSEIKPLRLTWSWACWTSFTHHRSAKLSKRRALLVHYLLSHKSNSTHPLPFVFLNK